nr:DUF3293 domain-containing protein [Vibrio vulnificus]
MECDSKLTHYHPNWLNFNSDNYPARGGFCSVLVADKACCWSEESFAVEINLNYALNLAREFQQNAIYFVEQGELFLVSCLSDERKESLGPFDQRIR